MCLFITVAASGGTIDITSSALVQVHTGGSVTAEFGVGNYGRNNPGFSPYPFTVGLLVTGQVPQGVAGESLPGSSQLYFPAIVFEAYLESMDGSISVPFIDSNATRLGLGPGHVIAVLGEFSASGTTVQVANLRASVGIPLSTSEALFGSNVGSSTSSARIRLVSLGAPFWLGIGDPYTVGQSIAEPGIRGLGPVQTAGLPGVVTLQNPEPSTGALLTLPGAVFWWLKKRRAA